MTSRASLGNWQAGSGGKERGYSCHKREFFGWLNDWERHRLSHRVKSKSALVALVAAAFVLMGGVLLAARTTHKPMVTLAFIGVTNSLSNASAAEQADSRQAVFLVTNHASVWIKYQASAQSSTSGGMPVAGSIQISDLWGNGFGTFMIPIIEDGSGWKIETVISYYDPEPPWQRWVDIFTARVGLPSFFLGAKLTRTEITNCWESSQLSLPAARQ